MPDDFTVEHADKLRYEVEDRDGTRVRVRIDEMRNGGRIGAYHYAADGTQLAYHSLRINNVDERTVVYTNLADDEVVPDAVIRALHAGGWEVDNLHTTDLRPDDEDAPLPVQFLDIRDSFADYAEGADSTVMETYFMALSRAIDHAVGLDITVNAVPGEASLDEMFREKAESRPDGPQTDEELVEGWFINAVYPETKQSIEKHDQVVEAAEAGRRAYWRGESFEEAFEAEMGWTTVTEDDDA